jgi:hypothetical protein
MTRSRPWLTAWLQTALLLSAIAFAMPWLKAEESSLPIPRRADDVSLRGHEARPVYNGSVVPGGVYSLDELRAAIERDPLVAEHYRLANLDAMQVVTLPAGRAAYVSYRAGDRIHWTRRRVWLRAGETVLTDGTTTVRARCGNGVSDVAQENVAAVDPAHGELDEFIVPPTPQPGVDLFAPEAEARLEDLLQVPFAYATLFPAGALLVPELVPDSIVGSDLTLFAPPPFVLPGGGGRGDVVFVPRNDTSSPVDVTSSTGNPTTTLTITTGFTNGDLVTTGGSSTTSGAPPTTGASTSSAGVSPSSTGTAPEPEMLWLVTAGLIGVASRRYRR